MGQAMLTDYAAATGLCALMIALAFLTRKKRARELGIAETLRMVAVWVAGVACLLTPAFQPNVTLTQGFLFASFIAIIELVGL